MTNAQRFAALAFILLLPACTTVGPIGINAPNYGEAESRNIAAQTVNPNAPNDSAPIDTDGQRAELAQRLYVTGNVITPADVTPSSGIAGGGGGMSGTGAAMGAGGAGSGGGAPR